MRFPTKKLYRAFSELDRFSDAQCELLMRRVQLDARGRFVVWAAPVVAFAVALLFVVIFLALTDVLGPTERLFRDADILLGLLCSLGMSAAVGLVTRDQLLRRFLVKAIRWRIDRVRCLNCRYILIGQRPVGDAVTCPECGKTNRLSGLGITADDLIPPESELDWLSSEGGAGREGA